ncbi:MAG TPA: glycosyltransferase [bacterium]|nr:glycosyltransferase [bacterium]HQL62469.1 glycosyltransferase [bacterium]
MAQFSRDPERIRFAYREYDEDPSRQRSRGGSRPSNRWVFEERAKYLEELLTDHGYWPLKGLRVLDIGCGSGHILEWLIENADLQPEQAFGVDLLPDRAAHAQGHLPDSQISVASADSLPFPDGSFDLALAFTLFSSLPTEALRTAVAREIQRILKPEGGILIYDFRYPNPRNRNTHPIIKSELRNLFPGWEMRSHTLTLLPPVGAILEKIPSGKIIGKCLGIVPILRSHRITFLRRPVCPEPGRLQLAWFCSQEKIERNRAAVQRLLYASKHYCVDLYGRGGQAIDPEILRRVRYHRSLTIRQIYLSHACFYLRSLAGIFPKAWRRQLQAVYTTVDYSAVAGFLLHTLCGTKWIVDVLDDPALELQTMVNRRPRIKYFLYSLYCKLLKSILRYADALPAIGTSLEEGLPETLQQIYHVPDDRIIPVSNGVDLSRTVGVPKYREADRFMVVYVGGITRVRGLEILIRAASIAKPKLPSLLVCLVGPHRREEELHELLEPVKELDLLSTVRHIGKVPHEEALNWMASADVCALVLTANIKNFQFTFSVKLFEYLALNRAVVAPDIPGVRLVLRHGENGLLYEPGNPESLAEAILRLHEEPERRKRLEQTARASIAMYDWNTINIRLFREIEKRL